MFESANKIIEICKKENKHLWELELDYQKRIYGLSEEEIYSKLYDILDVMENSATKFMKEKSVTQFGMIDGFSYMMNKYSSNDSISGDFMVKAMAMAFSTLEMSASMHKIVAAPTAGASGILPAAIISYSKKYMIDKKEQANALLCATCIGEFIAKYANFSGAEGGCQAECGSASAMASAGLVYLHGGDASKCFNAASFTIIHVLGLICDPIAGLVEYPCTFRNASGVVNAMISADMAMAGVTSVVPFEEVVKTMDKVGKEIPVTSRETGLGGLAATVTGIRIRDEFLEE